MKKIFFTLLILFCCAMSFAQVGINTTNPTETLDVNGTTTVRQKLYLENPGPATLEHEEFLVKKPDNTWGKHNVASAKYGPVNYSQLIFRRVPSTGMTNFNTNIPTDKYIVAVQGYYYYLAGGTNTNVQLRSNRSTSSSNSHIEGPQFYAFEQGGTWRIAGLVTQSNFKQNYGTNTQIDLYMNVVILRKDFFTKGHGTINVNMGSSTTGTAPLPAAFQ